MSDLAAILLAIGISIACVYPEDTGMIVGRIHNGYILVTVP